MVNKVSGIKTDKNQRELLEHGSALFPIACYHDTLTDNDIMWHWHEELEAIFITDGVAEINVGKEKHTLSRGEGIFVNAGVMHSLCAADAEGFSFHSLVFHPRLISGGIDSVFAQKYIQPVLDNSTFKGVPLSPSNPWHQICLDAIEIAWQSCIYKTPGYEFKVRSSLSDLLFQLWNHLPVIRRQPDAKILRDSDRIKAMLKYIHENHSSEISTKMIADSIMISESECLRCFHNTINTTPIQYVKQYRIQQASHMLVFTRDKIADIAIRCGFQDISYFTKTFRQLKGCVPSEYRALNSAQQ